MTKFIVLAIIYITLIIKQIYNNGKNLYLNGPSGIDIVDRLYVLIICAASPTIFCGILYLIFF